MIIFRAFLFPEDQLIKLGFQAVTANANVTALKVRCVLILIAIIKIVWYCFYIVRYNLKQQRYIFTSLWQAQANHLFSVFPRSGTLLPGQQMAVHLLYRSVTLTVIGMAYSRNTISQIFLCFSTGTILSGQTSFRLFFSFPTAESSWWDETRCQCLFPNEQSHNNYTVVYMWHICCFHAFVSQLRLQLKFEGVTVETDGLSVVCPPKQHVFTSVFIGDGNPPRQVGLYLLLHNWMLWCSVTYLVHKVSCLHANTCIWIVCCHFCLSLQQVYGLYNGCAVPFCYKVDLSVLSQLQKDSFDHPLLCCLNPEGKVLPGQTIMLEWIFSPMEAKMYQVSTAIDSPNTGIRFNFFLFFCR